MPPPRLAVSMSLILAIHATPTPRFRFPWDLERGDHKGRCIDTLISLQAAFIFSLFAFFMLFPFIIMYEVLLYDYFAFSVEVSRRIHGNR